MKRLASISIISTLLLTGPVSISVARGEGFPELITDRPDQTESSETVPPGYVQVEVGGTFVQDDEGGDVRSFSTPETLLRIGLMNQLELRLGFSGYIWERTDARDKTDHGAGDSAIGFKWKFFHEDGWMPQTALLGGLTLPTGAEGFSSERYEPSFRFAFSHTLTERVGLAYNLGMAWETFVEADGGRDAESFFQYTVAVGMDLTERVGAFAEIFGDVPMSAPGGSAHSVDAGLTYMLTDAIQLDTAAGLGISTEADDWFVTFGVSYIFPIFSRDRDRVMAPPSLAPAGLRSASRLR